MCSKSSDESSYGSLTKRTGGSLEDNTSEDEVGFPEEFDPTTKNGGSPADDTSVADEDNDNNWCLKHATSVFPKKETPKEVIPKKKPKKNKYQINIVDKSRHLTTNALSLLTVKERRVGGSK